MGSAQPLRERLDTWEPWHYDGGGRLAGSTAFQCNACDATTRARTSATCGSPPGPAQERATTRRLVADPEALGPEQVRDAVPSAQLENTASKCTCAPCRSPSVLEAPSADAQPSGLADALNELDGVTPSARDRRTNCSRGAGRAQRAQGRPTSVRCRGRAGPASVVMR